MSGTRWRAPRQLALLVSIALCSTAGIAHAQGGEPTTVRGGRAGRGVGRAERGLQRPAAPRQKALAQKVRQAFAGVVRERLNLSDDQVRQLQATDKRFQQQRNQIGRQERQTRIALAAALADTVNKPDEAKISQYVDQLVQAQHRRADLLEAEQKELGGFLTPVQRARYLALREQLNRRVKQLQQSGGAGRGAPPND